MRNHTDNSAPSLAVSGMAYSSCFKFYLASSTVGTIGEMGFTTVVNDLDMPICLTLKGIKKVTINKSKQF